MTEVPEGAQRSEDGQWWWDGSDWQPVATPGGQGAAPPAGSGEPPEVTAEDLQPVADTEPAPGRADLLTEGLQPYFAPNGDDVPDDESETELDAVLDENELTGPADG